MSRQLQQAAIRGSTLTCRGFLLGMALVSGCFSTAERLPENASYTIVVDDATKWTLHELRVGKDSPYDLALRVAPEAGGNAYSIRWNREELLRQAPSVGDLRGVGYGIPILYPTPNRVADGKFTFDGQTFEFPRNAGGNHIHGLVNDIAWRAEPIEFGDESIRLPLVLEVRPGSPVWEHFPFEHSVRVVYSVGPDGVACDVEITNLGTRRVPIGFALHPYFRIIGERGNTWISVPAKRHMSASRTTLLPTGDLEPLDQSRLDLRAPVSLAELELDDVYWGMTPDRPARFEARERGWKLTIEASEIFTHAVVYTPAGKDYFCIESQTCSTDAHNLWARGKADAAHLLVLEPKGGPGSVVKGRVLFRIEAIPTVVPTTGTPAGSVEPGESD
jgi:aldose 1-epimerase